MKKKMSHWRKVVALFMIFFCFTNVLVGQDQSIEDLAELSLQDLMNLEVITASKVAEKASDAPGIISTITAQEIEQFGAQSLVDVLERVAGTVNMSSFIRPQNVTSFRGDLSLDNDTHTLILVNGRQKKEISHRLRYSRCTIL